MASRRPSWNPASEMVWSSLSILRALLKALAPLERAVSGGRTGSDVDRPGAGFESVIGDVILRREGGGVSRTSARGQGDVVSFGTAVIPAREFEASVGAPRILRRIGTRSEEHTSELQSLRHLVCRL